MDLKTAAMTEAEWHAAADPLPLISWLGREPSPSRDRKLRLFACACWRQVWHLVTREDEWQAIEAAERYAEGLAAEPELAAARFAALGVAAGRGATAAWYANMAVFTRLREAVWGSYEGGESWRGGGCPSPTGERGGRW